MAQRIARLLTASSLCLALLGCGAIPAAGTSTARWEDASPSPSAGPDDLVNVLYVAMLEDGDFQDAGIGGSGNTVSVSPGDVDANPWRPCGAALDTDRDRRHAVEREFSSKSTQAIHRAFSYWDIDAVDVVAEIGKAARGCDRYDSVSPGGPASYTVHRSLDLPTMTGIDRAYGYCEDGDDGEYVWSYCYVALALGKVVSMIRINRAEQPRARDMVVAVAPAAAESLVRAVGPR